MHSTLMADSASETLQSDILGLRHISSSLFSIPGFIVGFGTKCLSDSDSVRSPTSPLDLKVFSNLSNPFGLRSPRTQSQNGNQKKWDSNKVGLGIINSFVNEAKPSAEVLDSPTRKNVIFGPQVKTNIYNASKHYIESLNSSVKSNSLPRNYTFSSLSKTRSPNPQLDGANVVFGNEGVALESEPTKTIASSVSDSSRGEKAFCSCECREEAIFADESEKSYNNSAESSPESSYLEDLFLMAMDDLKVLYAIC
ncbi:hypothetical protein CJ030_MR1G008430 [Morella rubra]|uniref:Uncharacterized protein n=1 Tax=Morella rubra TaxID=262757 RepID=A0A6A1WNA0_9ROSI|nr:hypothetical protein CJ030_MR3G026467 [Morella rubra]KAB1226721.1 hypothetical protein CJ030_MR1G008430 [Morella rubra]